MVQAQQSANIGSGGRIVIPGAFRKALGLRPGDEVVLLLEDGELRILTKEQAIRRAQVIVRKHVQSGRRLAEELIEERRAEARRE